MPRLGLSVGDYQQVINSLLAESDVALALEQAAASGPTRDAIISQLRSEDMIDDQLWAEVNEASGGAVAQLEGVRTQIQTATDNIVRRTHRLQTYRSRWPFFAAPGIVVSGIATSPHFFDWPPLSATLTAILTFVGIALLAASIICAAVPRLGERLPFLRLERQRLAGLRIQAKAHVPRVMTAAQGALGDRLRPLLTAAVHEAREEIARREQDAAEAANSPLRLLVTKAPRLLTGTRAAMEVVETRAHIIVESIVNSQATAAIGIAGPRGAGKSTLIDRFCQSQSLFDTPPSRTRIVGRVLGVKLSVPVKYQPRDFVLHLYAETCRQVLKALPEKILNPAWNTRYSGLRRYTFRNGSISPGLIPRTRLWALFLLGILLVGAGSAVVAWIWIPARWNIAMVGAISVLVGGILAVTAPTWRERAFHFRKAPIGITYLLSIVLVVTGVSLVAGIVVSFDWAVTAWAVCVAFGGGVLALYVMRILPPDIIIERHSYSRVREEEGSRLNEEEKSAYDVMSEVMSEDFDSGSAFSLTEEGARSELWRLRKATKTRLHNLQWQQALTHSVQGTASLNLPLTLEASTSREVALTERPQPHPELVSDYRTYLNKASTGLGGKIVIGIDELDKIANDEDAIIFINDIKDLFQLEACYFLVSVSESALHSFARRGLPVRDAFDTAFDQIVRIGDWTPRGSLDLIASRTVDFPWPVSMFCHAFTGGLPRDLIRLARRVIEVGREQGGALQVEHLFELVVLEDIAAQTKASIAVARDRDDWLSLDWLLALAGQLPERDEPTLGIAAVLDEVVGRLPSPVTVSGDGADSANIGLSVYAYLYCCATLLRLFALGRTQLEWDSSRSVLEEAADKLAIARQELAIHPRQAWSRTTAVRNAHGLDTLPWAGSSNSEGHLSDNTAREGAGPAGSSTH